MIACRLRSDRPVSALIRSGALLIRGGARLKSHESS